MDERDLRARLSHRALHDALTGLPNRTLFADRLQGALARSQRDGTSVGLIHCDLEGYEAVNGTLGIEAGDALLRTIARQLCELVRSGDTVARVRSDQFTIICPDSHLRGITALAGRLAEAMREPYVYDGCRAAVSISVAIASADALEDPARLLRIADRAQTNATRPPVSVDDQSEP